MSLSRGARRPRCTAGTLGADVGGPGRSCASRRQTARAASALDRRRRSSRPPARSSGPRTCWCSRRRRRPACSTERDALARRRWSRSSAFCLAASGTYFLNDANDAEADRLHPTKRLPPDRRGRARRAHAPRSSAVVLIVAGVRGHRADQRRQADRRGRRLRAGHHRRTRIWLKHEPVIDLAAVASGFVFRAIAGGVATGVPLSDWFLIVAGAGSLFIVTGKRHAEQVELGSDSQRAPPHARRVLHRVPRLRPRGRRRA